MRKIIIFGCMIAVSVVHGGVVSSDDSAPMMLDLRTGARESTGDETLTYSSLWDGGDGATVTIAQNGAVLGQGLTGEGERAWSVQQAGTYVLTHTTYTNGVAWKVETVTFVVTKNIASLAVGDIAGVTYAVAAFTSTPVVTDSACGYTLVNGTDYTLAYANNVNAAAVDCRLDVRPGGERAEHGRGEVRDGERDIFGDAAERWELHGDVHGAGDGELRRADEVRAIHHRQGDV